MNTSNFPGRVEKRRAEAAGRNEAWACLSFKDQLSHLDARLGKGVGAAKQRARILAMMEAPKKPVKGQKNPRKPQPEEPPKPA